MSATLTILGSNSSGNGYLLQAGKEVLILEAGVPVKDVLKALDYDISGVKGVIATHHHGDHLGYCKQYQRYFKICSTQAAADKHFGIMPMRKLAKYTFGGFKVLPLEVPHGDCECFAYHVTMPDGQTLLFATDLERFPYSIKGITHLMLECNYSNGLILDTLVNGDVLRSQSQNHMELEECIATVKRLRHGGLQSVILVHLSSGLSDIRMFKERFKSELGIDVEIAESGKNFSLESCEF